VAVALRGQLGEDLVDEFLTAIAIPSNRRPTAAAAAFLQMLERHARTGRN
jgi:hypothetical protein